METCVISPIVKIICITGYSGSGKTTMLKLMQKYLPNSHLIYRDGNKETRNIQFPDEYEKKYGFPVNTDDVMEYFLNVAAFTANKDINNAYADVNVIKKYYELVADYLEKKFEETLTKISTKSTSQYIIMDWISLPASKIWKKADYRIMVKPAKWDLLVKNVGKRKSTYEITPDIANARYLAAKDFVENAENITHVIINNYNEGYEQKIKDLCIEFITEKYG